jgi:hypothetical protein
MFLYGWLQKPFDLSLLLALSVDVSCMVRKALSSMTKFGVRTPLVSYKLIFFFAKIQIQTLLLTSKSKFEQLALLLWHFVVHLTMSYRQLQSSTENIMLATGMFVADVLVVTDDCTPFKCCMVRWAMETIADMLE